MSLRQTLADRLALPATRGELAPEPRGELVLGDGVELHYRGAVLPDLGLEPIPRDKLAVLEPAEIGRPEFTTAGWLSSQERNRE